MNIMTPQNQVLSVFKTFCAKSLKACSKEASAFAREGQLRPYSLLYMAMRSHICEFLLSPCEKKSVLIGRLREKENQEE